MFKDLQGDAKIGISHSQIEKEKSSNDEDMCALHNRKPG